MQWGPNLTAIEKMTALLAAIMHDLDHPGVNQSFLIATTNPLAGLYDVSANTLLTALLATFEINTEQS